MYVRCVYFYYFDFGFSAKVILYQRWRTQPLPQQTHRINGGTLSHVSLCHIIALPFWLMTDVTEWPHMTSKAYNTTNVQLSTKRWCTIVTSSRSASLSFCILSLSFCICCNWSRKLCSSLPRLSAACENSSSLETSFDLNLDISSSPRLLCRT